MLVTGSARMDTFRESGGCPEPARAASDIDAQRWQVNYFDGPSVFREPLLLTAVLRAGRFMLAQARAASPPIRLATLRDVGLRAGLPMIVLVASVMMGTLVVGPFYRAQGLGLDTAMVALAIALRSGFARGPTRRPAP